MLQTSILRTVRFTPRKADAYWWRRGGALLLPRIGSALGVLALAVGVLVALGHYADHQAEVRLAETSRHLEQFRSGPVGAAWARLRAAWQSEQERQNVLLARVASLHGAERAQALRDHRMFVLETVDEYGLDDEIEEVKRFVARLATCVRAGSCDPDVVAAQLGPALWAFRDQHQYYFALEYSGNDIDAQIASVAPRPEQSVFPAAPRR